MLLLYGSSLRIFVKQEITYLLSSYQQRQTRSSRSCRESRCLDASLSNDMGLGEAGEFKLNGDLVTMNQSHRWRRTRRLRTEKRTLTPNTLYPRANQWKETHVAWVPGAKIMSERFAKALPIDTSKSYRSLLGIGWRGWRAARGSAREVWREMKYRIPSGSNYLV